jgi:succinate-semialdehyde dehydrogenase/glutarate-semialdehyde dehydrogenase
MDYLSQNPATGEIRRIYPTWDDARLARALAETEAALPAWREISVAERSACLARLALRLRENLERLARTITAEMGKPIAESRAEIEKCAWGAEYYAERAEAFLAERSVSTEANRSYVAFEPLGAVLAVMPWNFPFWQVCRFALPALAAGNAVFLKHAPNVPECAETLETLCRDAGFPAGVMTWLPIAHVQTEKLIEHPLVRAVTLTGSERAGRRIAAIAGAALKKAVLELGGSDAFVVLEDADLDLTASAAIVARYQNGGQSCIAAKRFILVEAIADDFLSRFLPQVEALNMGDPLLEATRLGPLARADLRENLERQAQASIRAGAEPILGCRLPDGPGHFYPASVLDRVRPGMAAYEEELFGPAAAIVRVRDEREALAMANRHRLGLGGSVWTQDLERGERFARRLETGLAFVNEIVKSDPRMPFGGVKASGYGRELGRCGMLEFVNVKSVWLA